MQPQRLRHVTEKTWGRLGTMLSCLGCEKKWRTFHSFQEQELQLELVEVIAKNMTMGGICYLENICGAGQT